MLSAVPHFAFYKLFMNVLPPRGKVAFQISYVTGMKRIIILIGSAALLLVAYAPMALTAKVPPTVAEFVGSTPADTLPREFLGGLAMNAPYHNIEWRITLITNQNARSQTFTLSARYRVPTRANPNLSEDGPEVTSQGTYEVVTSSNRVYRLTAQKTRRSLSFVQLGDNLLHMLNSSGTLMVGNGGWSYTLNRADRAEKIVEPSVAMSAPDMSYPISSLATGSAVFAVFEGRTPCQDIARELNLPQHAGCHKVKWRVTLYQNPATSAPTTYKIEGSLHRQQAREGTWSVTRGTKADSNATVYQLNEIENEGPLLLLKADDNVLFFLNRKREFMVGNADFSYTLNRVAKN